MPQLSPALLVVTFAAMSANAGAQGAEPSFEVASIKVSTSPQSPMFYQAAQDRLSVGNVPLRMLIPLAYDVDPDQVSGGPAWIDTERFDLLAKAAAPFAPATQWRAMLRTLLVERFGLVVRREARAAQVFALVRARPDGVLGNDLRRAETTCEDLASSASDRRACRLRLARAVPNCPPSGRARVLKGQSKT